jgi:hypothetical protein
MFNIILIPLLLIGFFVLIDRLLVKWAQPSSSASARTAEPMGRIIPKEDITTPLSTIPKRRTIGVAFVAILIGLAGVAFIILGISAALLRSDILGWFLVFTPQAVIGFFFLVLARGLWRMRKWARDVSIALAILSINLIVLILIVINRDNFVPVPEDEKPRAILRRLREALKTPEAAAPDTMDRERIIRKWAAGLIGAAIVGIAIVVLASVNVHNNRIAEETTATARSEATATYVEKQARAEATQTRETQLTQTARAQATATRESIATATSQAQATHTARAEATQTAEAQATATASAIWAALKESAGRACSGEGGNSEAPPYSIYDEPVLIALYDTQRGRLESSSPYVSSDWIGESVEETQLVICLDEKQEILLESCPYSLLGFGSATNWIKRYREQQQIRIVALNTGYTTSAQIFYGEAPKYCPNQAQFSTTTITYMGKIDSSKVKAWIELYVAP